ncbi:MAG TPA: carotenoid biosynthesis protein [Chitinophagaceae bacterium]|nr:carotenoid biosynthesis protein [Chitinophagaceae bacterium]
MDKHENNNSRSFKLALLLFFLFVTATVIFSIPFFRNSEFSWEDMNLYLQGMVFFLAAATICHAYLSFRVSNTLLLFIVSFLVSYAAEFSGMRWAWPFGSRYHYNPAIFPLMPGGIPLCILLMWFMLAYTALLFFRPISVQSEKGSLSSLKLILKSVACGLYIMTADFVIDPLATYYKAWIWHEPGTQYGVPAGNYSGWFLVGFTICGSTIFFERSLRNDLFRKNFIQDLVFGVVAIILTMLCFAGFLMRIGSVWPVILSLTIMGSCWVYWAVSIRRLSRQLSNSSFSASSLSKL